MGLLAGWSGMVENGEAPETISIDQKGFSAGEAEGGVGAQAASVSKSSDKEARKNRPARGVRITV